MNRFLLTLLVALTAIVGAKSQNRICYFDFENGTLDAFITKDYDGGIPAEKLGFPRNTAWTLWNDPYDESNNIICSCSYYENEEQQAEDWFVIPNITLPEDKEACQLFWRSRSAWNTFKDGYRVYITTDVPNSGTEINDLNWKSLLRVNRTDNPDQWKAWQCDISKYAGKTVSIAFVNFTTNGWLLYLDDIAIGSKESVETKVVITSDKYIADGTGEVTAKLNVGIMSEIPSFTAQVVSGNETIKQVYNGLKITPGREYDLVIDQSIRGNATQNKDYSIELIDDKMQCFASASSNFVYLLNLEGVKNVVAESYISCYDGYSIRAVEGYKKLKEEPWFIGLQLHGSDTIEEPMAPADEEAYKTLLQGTYNIDDVCDVVIDRQANGEVYDDIVKLASDRRKMLTLVESSIEGICTDSEIEISAKTIFALNSDEMECDYMFVLTEDSVYNEQLNIYSGGELGAFNDYESLEKSVYIPFNDVVRRTYSADTLHFSDFVAGDTIYGKFVLPLDCDINNHNMLKMTMIVTDSSNGEILNAVRCNLTQNVVDEDPTTPVSDFVFDVINGENTLIEYVGDDAEVVLPDNYEGGSYVIGEGVFEKNTSITSVVIPTSVTSIGKSAFLGCIGLTSVTIPNSVTNIGDFAFHGCSGLTSVVIPTSVTSIGSNAFEYCSGLTSVTIGSGVKEVSSNAFTGCDNLANVYCLATTVPSTSSDAFNESYLEHMTLHVPAVAIDDYKTTEPWSSFGNIVTLDEEVVEPDIDTPTDFVFDVINGENTLVEYVGDDAEVVLPDNYEGGSYVIGEGAFENNTLIISITIPNSVISIGNNAFNGCSNLKEVYISDIAAWCNISFGNSAANPLHNAEELYLNGNLVTELVIPNSVISIEDNVFYGCSGLTNIEMPNSVISIGNNAFNGCSGLTSVTIPTSVTSIGNGAFEKCSGLTSIEIPTSVTSIGDYAFEECSGLTSIEIPTSVTSIGDYAFSHCSGLTNIVIPTSVTSIGEYAFSNCSGLTNIVIPNSVTSIGLCAFFRCSGLTSITIPTSVTGIGDRAFYGCSNLLEIKMESKKAISVSENIFSSYTYNNACLYTPAGCKYEYENTTPWNNFYSIVEMNSTAINEVEGEDVNARTVIYDLCGRRVDNPTKGMYIINGKKVLLK